MMTGAETQHMSFGGGIFFFLILSENWYIKQKLSKTQNFQST